MQIFWSVFFVCDTGKKEGREGGRKYNLSTCYVAVAFTLFFTNLHNDLVREVFPFYKRGNWNSDLLVFSDSEFKELWILLIPKSEVLTFISFLNFVVLTADMTILSSQLRMYLMGMKKLSSCLKCLRAFYLIFSKANSFRHMETKYRDFSISQRFKKSVAFFSWSTSFLLFIFSCRTGS